MTAAERLQKAVKNLPEDKAREVLDFVEFLASRNDDRSDWSETILALAAERWGDDEPEYTLADIKQQ